MPINVKSYFRSSSGTMNLISIHPTFELISREPIDWQTVVAVPAAEPPACYWLTRHRFNTWSVGARVVLPVSLFPDIHMCEMKLNLKRCWLSDTPEKKKKKKISIRTHFSAAWRRLLSSYVTLSFFSPVFHDDGVEVMGWCPRAVTLIIVVPGCWLITTAQLISWTVAMMMMMVMVMMTPCVWERDWNNLNERFWLTWWASYSCLLRIYFTLKINNLTLI